MDYQTYKEVRSLRSLMLVLFFLLLLLSVSTGFLIYFIQSDVYKLQDTAVMIIHELIKMQSN